MPFLDPTVELDAEVLSYRPVLEKLSLLLETGDLDGIPAPEGNMGPIRSVQISRALRDDEAEVLGQVKGHAIYLLKGDPTLESELRYNFNLLVLLDVFGLDEKDSDLYEPKLNKLLW